MIIKHCMYTRIKMHTRQISYHMILGLLIMRRTMSWLMNTLNIHIDITVWYTHTETTM